jgi:ribonuclease D
VRKRAACSLLPSPPVPENLRPEWIDTAAGVRAAAELCAANGRLALDTEADSMHSYFHKVCLIQVTADGRHMVIDPLALAPGDLDPLWGVVSDPGVPVLMHGADYDFRVLDRDYGARIHGLQDTQIMALLLGEEKTGLAALLEKELGIHLDKRHQRADWGRRPLTRSQVAYAAADTAYLGGLGGLLRARLEGLGRWAWALEEFENLERVRFSAPEQDPLAFERIKGARALRGEARDRLFTLHGWREGIAQNLDVPPFKVLGNRQLVLLAEDPPADRAALGEVDGVGPRAVRRWGRELLHAVSHPKQAPKRVKAPRPPNPPPEVRRRLKNLSAARDAQAKALGLQEGLVCSRSCAEAVAARQPRCASFGDLAEAGLKGWRLEVLGEAFLAALAAP